MSLPDFEPSTHNVLHTYDSSRSLSEQFVTSEIDMVVLRMMGAVQPFIEYANSQSISVPYNTKIGPVRFSMSEVKKEDSPTREELILICIITLVEEASHPLFNKVLPLDQADWVFRQVL